MNIVVVGTGGVSKAFQLNIEKVKEKGHKVFFVTKEIAEEKYGLVETKKKCKKHSYRYSQINAKDGMLILWACDCGKILE